jgi:predicted amidohydrolase YtcJ
VTEPSSFVLRDADVDGRLQHVVVEHGQVVEVGPDIDTPRDFEVVTAHGGALLPGLHDHHVHLLGMAAAENSVRVGPADVKNADELVDALRNADRELPSGQWLRAVGYHESVAGSLNRAVLDHFVPNRPVRIQDRTGSSWVLNSAAIIELDLEARTIEGAERDNTGRLTGRLYRLDDFLRQRLHEKAPPPDVETVSRRLASCGVTGVTDATPYEEPSAFELLAQESRAGRLAQHVMVTGSAALVGCDPPDPLLRGPVKIVISDHSYPDPESVSDTMRLAHDHDRPVAVHCVTRTALALALAAWDTAGSRAGDRVEHASVAPPAMRAEMARHRLTVVTQPGFITERGDQYLTDVEPDDRPHLYPLHSLLDEGLAVGLSTDAPYTDADPWRAIASATTRRTAAGATLGEGETIMARQALDRLLSPLSAPGASARRIEPGEPADLCLLHVPLREMLRAPTSDAVRATWLGGVRVGLSG